MWASADQRWQPADAAEHQMGSHGGSSLIQVPVRRSPSALLQAQEMHWVVEEVSWLVSLSAEIADSSARPSAARSQKANVDQATADNIRRWKNSLKIELIGP